MSSLVTPSPAESRYRKISKLGEGTYAVVYEAEEVATGKRVAIKKIKVRQRKDGLDVSALREIKALQELRHPNILELMDVYVHKGNLNLVLEYLDSDLEQIIKDKSVVFTAADIKSWMLMTLRGVEHCHRNWILHRDLKPNNLLLASDGQLKLADFGLAREYADHYYTNRMSPQVVTLWYRAPELLLGARDYGAAVDIWSVGCIFAELMLRTPYLPGEREMQQLDLIFRALGTPTEKDWPGISEFREYMPAQTYQAPPLSSLFKAASRDAQSLLAGMLQLNPAKRLTAREALLHPYFQQPPRPTPHERLPKTNTKPKNDAANTKRKWDILMHEDADQTTDQQTPKKPVGRRLFTTDP